MILGALLSGLGFWGWQSRGLLLGPVSGAIAPAESRQAPPADKTRDGDSQGKDKARAGGQDPGKGQGQGQGKGEGKGEGKGQRKGNSGGPPRAIEVIELPAPGPVAQASVTLTGEVQASQQSTLRAQVGGVVKRMLVQVGDRVSPGSLVAVLEDTDQQLDLTESQGQLAQAQSGLRRLEVGTRPEILRQRQAELRSAQAQEREAQTKLAGLQAVRPKLLAQKQAELAAARTRERTSQDNLTRVKALVLEGAQSQRLLIEAQGNLDLAKSDRLRAEAALAAQQTDLAQQIAVARTGVSNAESDRLRSEAILAEARSGPTKEERETKQAEVATAQSRVLQAQLAQRRTQILANTSGVVQSRQVGEGDLVQSGGSIAVVVTNQSLEVFLELPETLSSQIRVGTPVTLTARALPAWKTQATVTAIVPSAEPSSRSQLVRVALAQPPQGLVPGMAIEGQLQPSQTIAGYRLSRDWLTRREDKWLLFTVVEQEAQPIEVTMVADLGTEVVVQSRELKTGQRIVSRGGDGLRPGMKVRMVGQPEGQAPGGQAPGGQPSTGQPSAGQQSGRQRSGGQP